MEKITVEEYRKITGANGGGKYKNVKKLYNGVLYDSVKEARFAEDLDLRLKANDITGWARQITFPLKVNEIKVCDYIIDFIIFYQDKPEEYIEVKGFWTKEAILKRKLFKALNPGRKYIVIE